MKIPPLMKFDPATGKPNPYPSEAAQWRYFHGHATAWLFDPYSGTRRTAQDVGSDTAGYAVVTRCEHSAARINCERLITGRADAILAHEAKENDDGR